jgi:multidrug efflux pump subunit AcrA (membrane-fusion protein)
VQSLRPNVYRQSPRNPLKVVGVKIKLHKDDPSRLRAGMQFRGRLETGRIKGALLVPVGTVFARSEGPVVFRKTASGWQQVPVKVGQRSATMVEIRAGVSQGDRLADRDMAEGSS